MVKFDVIRKCVNHFVKREMTYSIMAEQAQKEKDRDNQTIVHYYRKEAQDAREAVKELKKLLEMN